jgi:hypothetical protein
MGADGVSTTAEVRDVKGPYVFDSSRWEPTEFQRLPRYERGTGHVGIPNYEIINCMRAHFARLLLHKDSMNETTSYSVTFRIIMAPPDLDVSLPLIGRAQAFAKSLVTSAVESLDEYEYIAGPIQVQEIKSSLTRKLYTTSIDYSRVYDI